MSIAAIENSRCTIAQYHRMAETGRIPPGVRTELLDGVVYTMSPQGSGHATTVQAGLEVLRVAFPGDTVRVQMPLILGDDSEPEPDLAVVPGDFRRYRFAHPTTALLVVEVADSSLRHDRGRKVPIYARFGLPEVWILGLRRPSLAVFRDPVRGLYRTRILLRPGESLSPLARPEVSIAVADLLP